MSTRCLPPTLGCSVEGKCRPGEMSCGFAVSEQSRTNTQGHSFRSLETSKICHEVNAQEQNWALGSALLSHLRRTGRLCYFTFPSETRGNLPKGRGEAQPSENRFRSTQALGSSLLSAPALLASPAHPLLPAWGEQPDRSIPQGQMGTRCCSSRRQTGCLGSPSTSSCLS